MVRLILLMHLEAAQMVVHLTQYGEFYAYDHDLSSLTSFVLPLIKLVVSNMCAAKKKQQDTMMVQNNPVVGVVYTDSGTTTLGNGFYKHGGNICFKIDNGTGEVTQTQGCRSERHLKKNIKFIGNSENGIPCIILNIRM